MKEPSRYSSEWYGLSQFLLAAYLQCNIGTFNAYLVLNMRRRNIRHYHLVQARRNHVLADANEFTGAGAAGASTAWHLQRYAAEAGIAINVTVFERNMYIGGRTTTVNAYGNSLEPVELGASIFVEVNAILKNSSELFGLRPRESGTDENEVLGIWNGKTFVYTQKDSGWRYWDIAKLLWKYGFAPIRTQNLMKATVGKFLKLYEYPFFPFRSLTSRIYDLELVNVTAQTGEQFLSANNVRSPRRLHSEC